MKAVFIHQYCLLRDSHLPPDSDPDTWRLMPATLEAVRSLASDDMLVFVYGPGIGETGQDDEEAVVPAGLRHLVRQIEGAGGRVDGVVTCTRQSHEANRCFGDYPGLIWLPARQFDLRPEACYVLGDSVLDVQTALAAGSRPLVILCNRSVEEVFGRQEMEKTFPMAVDLTTAVSYIGVEEEINQQIGHPRNTAPPIPPEMALYTEQKDLPLLTVTSRMAQGLQARLDRSRIQRTDVARWLVLLMVGALGLSLGIAYLLTHLYRVQPFPEFAYYVTLQFIPRPLRGGLFIAWGVAIIVLAMRSFLRGTRLWSGFQERQNS